MGYEIRGMVNADGTIQARSEEDRQKVVQDRPTKDGRPLWAIRDKWGSDLHELSTGQMNSEQRAWIVEQLNSVS